VNAPGSWQLSVFGWEKMKGRNQMETTATERAAQIRTQLTKLHARKQETEAKLAEEHAGIRRAAAKRGELVESLTAGDVSRTAHRQIDELDSTIRIGERTAESLQKALAKTVNETQVLHDELTEAERVIRAEERAKGLEAFRINLQQAARRASESLDNARADLAALTTLETKAVLAANGDAAHEGNIHRICEPILEEFTRQQANLDSRGWRLFPGFRGLQFLIRPMTRG
jgi:DNA-binding transcriptional regulator YdaS (Cro superfamily)